MYHRHFGLAAEPFTLTPDPTFFFLGRQHGKALAAIETGIRAGHGFVTVVGEVGTGKTIVLYALLGRLDADASTAFVSSPTRDFVDLLRLGLTDFGVDEHPGTDRAGLVEALHRHVRAMADAGRPAALVIDEAQNLSDETFEQLRLLSNVETASRAPLRIVLAGQPELEARLSSPHLRGLRERVSVRAVLEPLEDDEMLRYLAHRLERAGGAIDVFTPRARRLIVRRAGGIPRRANILCHNALQLACARGAARVSVAAVREGVRGVHGRRTWNAAPFYRRWWVALNGGVARRVPSPGSARQP